ncbi:hypothetical protein [Aquimarina sediminis]|uniref:hypothetical protein n=1 Tax=Aquimarina sediminis TaxID=2070536 RepID=UPI000CA01F92|nr:hypothetical protein [Aquimarina sediminis]
MIKTLKFVSILLIFLNCKAQPIKEIGIGILETNTNFDISLFKNHTDTIPEAILRLKQMKNGQVRYESPIVLDPYVMSEGESVEEAEELFNSGLVTIGPILKFIVTEETATYFKVIVNEAKGTKYYIKKNTKAIYHNTRKDFEASLDAKPFNEEWFIYETWERYLKRVEYIELNTLEVYDKPNGNIIFSSKSNDFFSFNVVAMEGEWIKLKKDELREFNFEKGIDYEGWYQWKKGNEWRIQIVEFTIE